MRDALILYAVIRDIEPAISRRVVVPASITLPQVHIVLQILFGWEDCHLWQFEFGKVDYACTDVDDDFGSPGRECRSARAVSLADALGAKRKFSYWYDFGDDWFVDIKFERRIASDQVVVPVCTEGARAGPPDDCGGVPGCFRLLEVLAGPADEEREHFVEWLGGEFDPEAFDLVGTSARLKRAFTLRKSRAKPTTLKSG